MKRKKQKRLLILLLLLLAAAAIGYGFLLRYNKKQEEAKSQEENTSIAIYPKDFDSSAIASISYLHEDETLSFSLKKDKETWQYDGNTKFPLNQSSVNGIKTQLQSLTASRKVQSDQKNAADYGLSEPSQQVTVKDSDGTELTIYFGNTNDSAGVTYIYTSETSGIYTIDAKVKDYFSHSLLEMIQEDELPTPDSTAAYQKITIQKGEQTTALTFKEGSNAALDPTERCSWFADQNGESFAVSDDAVSNLTDALNNLSTEGCAAYEITDAQKATYGLDHPSAVITFGYTQEETKKDKTSTVSHTFTLNIGKQVGDYSYVSWDKIAQVYLMSTASLDAFMNCEKSDLISMQPLNFQLASIQSIEIKYQDLTFDYQIKKTTEPTETTNEDGETVTEEQEKTIYMLNGEEIEETEFTGLLTAMQSIAAEKLYPTEEGNVPLDDNAVTITVTLDRKERSQVKLILTPYDNNYYALYIDETPSYLINKTDVSSFINLFPIEN